jgi:hypothetical protein
MEEIRKVWMDQKMTVGRRAWEKREQGGDCILDEMANGGTRWRLE